MSYGRHLPRRDMLGWLGGLGALGLGAPARGASSGPQEPRAADPAAAGVRAVVRPPRLRAGDRVGLVNPASAAWDTEAIEIAQESLEALGLEVVLGPNYYRRRGYFAGEDRERAADIMRFVQDPTIKALFARGGWGSARVLPYLDFDVIRANPKVFAGYSDVTALLSAIYRRAGLVTFHCPFPRHRFSADSLREVVFEGATPTFRNPALVNSHETVQTEDRVQFLNPGRASGLLVGGNLSVLSAIVGTPYVPDFEGAILFLEDIDEAIYRLDRMLTQLALAGHLRRLAGFVFGHCTDCPPGKGHGSLTLEDVLRDHFGPLGIPAYRGALFGHIERQFTLPIGAAVELDAEAGTLRLLAPAVT
jgi:muramoyltetrapeptide carboxypeptidase